MATKTLRRPGTRSQVRYVRMSASKARVVLNLVRGKHVGEADQILQFSERLAAKVIQKCLRSAVANAGHNDEIPADELFISACYADEGPTLKRFRPRARGRAGRIHKQTCHITVELSRYSEEELDGMRRSADARGTSRPAANAPDDRRRRVAKSRQADELEETIDEVEETEVVDAEIVSDEVAEVAADAEDVVEEEVAEAEEIGDDTKEDN